jgi:hypothetical protein
VVMIVSVAPYTRRAARGKCGPTVVSFGYPSCFHQYSSRSVSWQPALRQSAQLTRASHWCPSGLPSRPAAKMLEADGRRARAYLRRNLTFPLDVEPWGGRRCAALPRYVECPATTVAYAISTLGPRAAVRRKSPCASCAALLWQTAPRRAICGSDRPFSALRDHFVRDFQQPASECESDAPIRASGPVTNHWACE